MITLNNSQSTGIKWMKCSSMYWQAAALWEVQVVYLVVLRSYSCSISLTQNAPVTQSKTPLDFAEAHEWMFYEMKVKSRNCTSKLNKGDFFYFIFWISRRFRIVSTVCLSEMNQSHGDYVACTSVPLTLLHSGQICLWALPLISAEWVCVCACVWLTSCRAAPYSTAAQRERERGHD